MKKRTGLFVLAVVGTMLSTSPVARARGLQTPWPLGVFTLQTQVHGPCLTGYSCRGFNIDQCPGASQGIDGILAAAPPTGTARGMVLFFSGSGGTSWWTSMSNLTGSFMQGLQSQGLWVFQVRWRTPWMLSAPGEDAGSAHMACRPATVVRWVHDNRYVPLGITSGLGECGFCITGNSGGSAQVAYALSFYGLGSILDADVPTSGPTHTALTKGCLRQTADQHYWYADNEAMSVDDSFGFDQQTGSCHDHDASYVSRWDAESIDIGGNEFVYPTTRVVILVGAKDCGDAPAHGAAFYSTLVGAGTPLVSMSVIENMGHYIESYSNGLAELHDALLDLPIGHPGTPCYPLY
jgi:hypothetical protein